MVSLDPVVIRGSSFRWLLPCAFVLLGLCGRAQAQTKPLVLISETDSTRAIAFESVTFTRQPFPLNSLISWSPDSRTRIVLFALNLQLQAGETPASITADAEDVIHRHYALKVESVDRVPGQPWLATLNLRLSDDLGDVGDVLVRITHNSQSSNRVRIAIGHAGGGLPDDPGSEPTPAPPYAIRGRITADGAGIPNVAVTLSGFNSGPTTTDAQGNYSILASEPGDYELSIAKPFWDFAPSNRTFVNLSNRRDGVDFTAGRQKRTIQGSVKNDTGQPFSNLQVTLAGGEPSTVVAATTDSTGSFSFPNLLAGLSYTVRPASNNFFSIAEQNVTELASNTTLIFNAARRAYSIDGQVTDPSGAVAGARIDLLPSGISTMTDASGNYTFSGLPARFDYTCVVSKSDYVFALSSFLLPQLDANRRVDFQGTPNVILSGRVLDSAGRGVAGVKVSWAGPQSGATSTDIDGTYSFLVTTFGNYTLTPAKEQDYYSYAPATTSVTTSGNRVADFTAALNASVSPSYVLEFDGAPKTVDYSIPHYPPDWNLFWPLPTPDGRDYGHFFWEFWAMPGQNAGGTYVISDGYGGAHAILFGFSNLGGREPGRYQLMGNIWNGNYLTYFGSDEGPAPDEWCHLAAGWDGQNIIVYFNGVPVGQTPWTGPRITPGGIQGCGRLLIGGSDHSNFIGRLAQVRGYENNNPREVGGNSVYETFRPETVFSVDGNLLSYYFRPSEDIADLSLYGQYGKQHPGLVRSTANGVLYPCTGCPLPQFVIDPTAPDFAHPDNPGQPVAPIDNPTSVPPSALVFDSFARRNATYAFGGAGGLSATEGGTLGTRNWLTDSASGFPQPFGILNGRAVNLANVAALTWVSIPSALPSLDIRVDRRAGAWGSGQNTGIGFRVADAKNYFFAYSSNDASVSQPKKLTVGYCADGLRTNLAAGIAMPADWTSLRVVTNSSGSISVYANNTLVYTTNNSFLASSTGAGLYNSGPGLGLTNRWDNFVIFPGP